MHPDLLSAACRLYATTPDQLSPLSGGNSTAVYQFPLSYASGHAVLRIGVEDCPAAQTLGMLDWVSYLKVHGAPVTAPIPSICGNLMESLQYDGTRYTLTAFEKADGTLAEEIREVQVIVDHAILVSAGRELPELSNQTGEEITGRVAGVGK